MRALPLLSLALIVGLSACEPETPTNVTPDDLQVSFAKGGKWAYNVTAGGEDLYPGGTDATFAISLNAKVDYDGNATGKVEWDYLDGTPASYGSVYCLEVRGNRAYISYHAEGGAWPGYGTPGYTVLIGLEDNGEGGNAPADRQSYIYYAYSDYSCVAFANFVENTYGFPVEWAHGNVQVR